MVNRPWYQRGLLPSGLRFPVQFARPHLRAVGAHLGRGALEPVGDHGDLVGGVVGEQGAEPVVERLVDRDDPGGGLGLGHHPHPAPVGGVGSAPRVSGAFQAVEDPGDGAGGEVHQLGEVTGGQGVSPAPRMWPRQVRSVTLSPSRCATSCCPTMPRATNWSMRAIASSAVAGGGSCPPRTYSLASK